MVYIGRDGRVLERQPWGWDWFVGIVIGFYTVVVAFFSTLLSPLTELVNSSNNDGVNRNRRGGGSGWGGGGGSGGGGGGGGRGPGAPQRRIGRVTTISDCTIPGGG